MKKRSNKSGFSLLEVMVIVGVVSILASLAMPHFARARRTAARSLCVANLRQLEEAKQQWAMQNNAAVSSVPADEELFGPEKFLRTKPQCPLGGSYSIGKVDEMSTCSLKETDGHLFE